MLRDAAHGRRSLSLMKLACALVLVAACEGSPPPAPVAPAPVAQTPVTPPPVQPDAAQVTPASFGCLLLPQPAKPGHSSVEPDDMACTHGDDVYECPDDAAPRMSPLGCWRATSPGWWPAGRTWCCPGP